MASTRAERRRSTRDAGSAAPRRWASASLAGTLWLPSLGGVLLVYLLRLDHVCGLYVDDAWYVLLGKALATGRGYSLINAPTPGILPFYPPGFPWALSLVWRAAPRFPENVWALKAISIAAMLGAAELTRRWCLRDLGLAPALAAGIALATALHPALVFFATSTVMSEALFLAVELAVVVVLEDVARGRGGVPGALAGGLLGGFAFLVRSAGLGLLVAAGLYLGKARRWRAGLAFLLGATAVGAPWVLHARAHLPTPEQQAEMNDPIAIPYTTHFWFKVAEDPSGGTISVADLPARMWRQAETIATRSAGALTVYPLYQTLDPGGWGPPAPGATLISLASCGLILIGFVAAARRRIGLAEILVPITLLIVVLWPGKPTRQLLPMIPFTLCYAARGVRTLAKPVTGGDGWGTALAAILALAGVSVATHVVYIRQLRGPAADRPVFVQLFDEVLGPIHWARDHVPAGQPVAAPYPALTYLYSGHQAVGVADLGDTADPTARWARWRQLGIHYLVDTAYLNDPPIPPEGRFTTVYRSPELHLRVLDLHRIYEAP
ncbi:MAG TPA: hypothetical protein VKW76_13030 [Candidatus Binatia bacterium]|nr:hypothetical protein [Candidatus Binatia bacterium]